MSGWIGARWAAFDVESTGVSTSEDRIVTAHLALIGGGHDPVGRSWLIDPGIDIPEAATKIHGITTEHAREHGRPAHDGIASLAAAVSSALAAGIPIVGFNVVFDLSMLDAECVRYGLKTMADRLGGPVQPVIDGLVLDKACDQYRKGSRRLVDVAKHYGITLDESDAHGAEADALAAARVVWKIARAFPQIAELDLGELHTYQVEQALRQQASLEAYFRRTKPDAVVERGWPVREPVIT